MVFTTTMEEFYRKNSVDVKKLLSKYGRSLIYSSKDLRDLAQSFYVMLIDRRVLERFDTTVTNIDKVFTSYMCVHLKCFCHEERRRVAKEESKLSLLITSSPASRYSSDGPKEPGDVFDSLAYSWSSKGDGVSVSTDADFDCLKEGWALDSRDIASDFRRALSTDGDLSDSERAALLSLVDMGEYGDTPGEMSVKMGCRSSRVSFFRKRAQERYAWYKEAGYV